MSDDIKSIFLVGGRNKYCYTLVPSSAISTKFAYNKELGYQVFKKTNYTLFDGTEIWECQSNDASL